MADTDNATALKEPRSVDLLFIEYFINEYASGKTADDIEKIKRVLFETIDSNNIFEQHVWDRALAKSGWNGEQLCRLLSRKLKQFGIELAGYKDVNKIDRFSTEARIHAKAEKWAAGKRAIAADGYDLSAPGSRKLIEAEIEKLWYPQDKRKERYESDFIQIVSPYASFRDRKKAIGQIALSIFFTFIIASPIVWYLFGGGPISKIHEDPIAKFWLSVCVTIELWGSVFVLFVLALMTLGKSHVLDKFDYNSHWKAFYAIVLIAIMSLLRHLAYKGDLSP